MLKLILALFAVMALALSPITPAVAMTVSACSTDSAAGHHAAPDAFADTKASCCTALTPGLAPLPLLLAPPAHAPIATTAARVHNFAGTDPSSEDPPPRPA